ncbi:peroxisomal targeting signal 1 receptor-like [Panonychus citri]|uniref:peroxisomal targeting signal 1 receptor-like n=1 Tax=Panonychus citri TaxID=50023 RepID=UPI0023072E03|nr:peroxisomal targeting signal 1 receptor-like [Panonychus citri]
MALRNLVDKDCGGNNPLINLTNHFNSDQLNRRWNNENSPENQLNQIPDGLQGSDRFAMESLLQSLGPMGQSKPEMRQSPAISGQELMNLPDNRSHHQTVAPNSHYWLDDFLASSSSSSLPLTSATVASQSSFSGQQSSSAFPIIQGDSKSIRPLNSGSFQRPPSLGHQWPPYGGGSNSGFMRPSFMSMLQRTFTPRNQLPIGSKAASEYLDDFHRTLEEEKVKADQVEALRKDYDTSTLPEEARKFVESMRDDPEVQSTDFLNFIKKIGSGEYQVTEDGIIANDTETDALSQAWASEFATAQEVWESNAVRDDQEFWDSLSSEWAADHKGANSRINNFPEMPAEFMADADQDSSQAANAEYKFNSNNPYQDVTDPFAEGMKRLEEGDIPSAVLHFEAACQKDPSQHLYWQFLGTSQAQNEHDSSAILALKKCIQLEPNNLIALMALAVSHTNQSEPREACENLFLWIIRNPHYSSLVPEEYKTSTLEVVTSEKIRRVRDMYLQAARLSPHPLDADIQCGLGVLLNLTGEYSKAADCFRAALSVRPDDSTIWNRLGATLANGDRSEEAVAAYEKALSLSPGFIRSRFNLGIACINLGAHLQAAEHFLSVLNLQRAGQGVDGQSSHKIMSANVWSTLRLVLSLMSRQDLYKFIDSRDLESLNRQFNINSSDYNQA